MVEGEWSRDLRSTSHRLRPSAHPPAVPRGAGTLGAPTAHLLLFPPQVVYYSEMHKIFGDLTQQLAQPGRPDEQRERENEARLSELRALSIVADD